MTEATKARAQQISLMAFKNAAPDDDWDLSDLKLYHALRLLYAEYAMLLVSQKQASAERAQLVKAWREEKLEMVGDVNAP